MLSGLAVGSLLGRFPRTIDLHHVLFASFYLYLVPEGPVLLNAFLYFLLLFIK